MKIEHEFTVDADIETAWATMTDVPLIVPCMPGAELTGAEGDTYQGRVTVKIGPVTSRFAGTARFTEKDDAAHRAVIEAKGRDSRGSGTAAAAITIALRPGAASGTTIAVDTDLKISGKIAQFGSSMIGEVSEKLLAQFVSCLEGKLHPQPEPELVAAPVDPLPGAPTPSTSAPSASAPTASAPTASGPSPSASSAPTAAAAPAATPSLSTAAAPAATRAPAHASAPVQPVSGPAPLDLMELAGGSVAKRAAPAVVGLVVLVLAVLLLRRRRH